MDKQRLMYTAVIFVGLLAVAWGFNATPFAIILQPKQLNVGDTLSFREEIGDKVPYGVGEWIDASAGRYIYIDKDSFLKNDLKIKLIDVDVGGGGVGEPGPVLWAMVNFWVEGTNPSRIVGIKQRCGTCIAYPSADGSGGWSGLSDIGANALWPEGSGVLLTGRYIDVGRDCSQLYGMLGTDDPAKVLQECLNPTYPGEHGVPFTARTTDLWGDYGYEVGITDAVKDKSAKVGVTFQIALDDRFSDVVTLVDKQTVPDPDVILEVTRNESGGVEITVIPRGEQPETPDVVGGTTPIITLPPEIEKAVSDLTSGRGTQTTGWLLMGVLLVVSYVSAGYILKR